MRSKNGHIHPKYTNMFLESAKWMASHSGIHCESFANSATRGEGQKGIQGNVMGAYTKDVTK